YFGNLSVEGFRIFYDFRGGLGGPQVAAVPLVFAGRNMSRESSREQNPFWYSSCGCGVKRALMVALVLCFALQTYFVYSDRSLAPRLSEKAQVGRQLWHRHNCQSCHQLYGYGGFLGPDLTNPSPLVTADYLGTLLTQGVGQMPAFHFNEDEIAAMDEFLHAMNSTGRGQARRRFEAIDPYQFMNVMNEELAKSEATPGFELFQAQACLVCHTLWGPPPTGVPDLWTVSERLPREQILKVLEQGSGVKMPAPKLSVQEREAVYQFLAWLAKNRKRIHERLDVTAQGELRWSEIPWWEY
ncbi:MAG: cytochrome c, partial [Planctomycetota bacterium]